ncbi:MAG: outer membrane beta-barrel protein [Akkermansia sp.]|nr:outer membrane beta-barrel protein [Akkermansia sp.]
MKINSILSLLALGSGAALAAPVPAHLPVYTGPGAPAAANPVYDAAPAYTPAAAPVQAEQAAVPMPESAPAAGVPFYREPVGRHEVSARFLYGFSAAPSSEFETDVFGLELQYGWHFTPAQALTLTMGFASGSEDCHSATLQEGGDIWEECYRFSRGRFSLMGGYQVSRNLTPWMSVYAGAKAGLDVSTFEIRNRGMVSRTHRGHYDCCDDHSHSTGGFAYAGTVGMSFNVSPRVTLDLGYQYYGSTTKPKVQYNAWYGDASTPLKGRSMRWHEVHVGATFHF